MATPSQASISVPTPPETSLRAPPFLMPSLPFELHLQVDDEPPPESPSASMPQSCQSHPTPMLTHASQPPLHDSQSWVAPPAVAGTHELFESAAVSTHSGGGQQGVGSQQGGAHAQSSESLVPPVLVGVAGLHPPALPCLDVTAMYEAAGAFIKLGRDSAQTVQALLCFQQQQQLLQPVLPQQQQERRWRQQHPHLPHLDQQLWQHNQRQLQQRREVLRQQQQELQLRRALVQKKQQEKRQQRHQNLEAQRKMQQAQRVQRVQDCKARAQQQREEQQRVRQERYAQVLHQQQQQHQVPEQKQQTHGQDPQQQQQQQQQSHPLDVAHRPGSLLSVPAAMRTLPDANANQEFSSERAPLPPTADRGHPDLPHPSLRPLPALAHSDIPASSLEHAHTQLAAASPPAYATSAGLEAILATDPSPPGESLPGNCTYTPAPCASSDVLVASPPPSASSPPPSPAHSASMISYTDALMVPPPSTSAHAPSPAHSASTSGHTDALMAPSYGSPLMLRSLAGSASRQPLALDAHVCEMARMGLVLSYERMVSWADCVLTVLAFIRQQQAAQQGVGRLHRPPRFDLPLQGVTWYGIHTDSLFRQCRAWAVQQQQQQQQQRQQRQQSGAHPLQGHGKLGQQQQQAQTHVHPQFPLLDAFAAQQQQQQQQQQLLTAPLTLPASLEHHVLQSRQIQRVRGAVVMRVWRALYAMGWTDLAQADRVAQIMVAFRLRPTLSPVLLQHRRAARRIITTPWTKARGLPLQDAAESLVVFSDLAAAHQLQHSPPGTAILAFLRILLKRVVVDAHLIDPDTLQQVARSVATVAEVFRDDPREQALELQPGSYQSKEPHSRGNHQLLRGMLPLSKGAYLLQVLAAAAAYNTVLTPTPVVVGDEGMGAVRGVLERAAQACMQPGSSSLLRELRPAQGATLLLGLACGGVTDARTLLQRVLGMRMYGPERLSLRVMANLAAACAASTEASQPGAAHGSRASGSSSSNSSEGAYVKDSTTPRSGSTCSTGSTEPETGLHLSNQSSTRAPSAANQEGLRSPSFYYQHALEAAVAAVKVCGDGGREFDKGQKTGVRRRLSRKSNRMGVRRALRTQQEALADTLAAAAAVGGRLPLTPREFLWLHKASEVVISKWNMAASRGAAEAGFSPVYAVQLLQAYVQLGLANEQLMVAAEDLFTVTTRNMKPPERAAFVKVLGLMRQRLQDYCTASRRGDEAVEAEMVDDHDTTMRG